jgi:hypothetical protein
MIHLWNVRSGAKKILCCFSRTHIHSPHRTVST